MLLFSATLPSQLAAFARADLRNPTIVRLDTDTKLSPDLGLSFLTVSPEDKLPALLFLVHHVLKRASPTLVFVATKHHVELVASVLTKDGFHVSRAYGDMDQAARSANLGRFRAGKT